jgi:hypothetical protein
MNKITKSMTIGFFLIYVTNSFASATNSDVQVRAIINPTCFISSQDYNFGILESVASITQQMTLRCNKDTTITVSVLSKTNPQGFRSGFMTKNAQQVPQNGNVDKPTDVGVRYYFDSTLVQNTPSLTVVRRPYNNVFQFKIFPDYDYSMQLKLNTGNTVNVPIIAKIHSTYNSKLLVPGNYYDIATYVLEF